MKPVSIKNLAYPLVAVSGGKPTRLLGSTTRIGKNAIATCSHVIERLGEDEKAAVIHSVDSDGSAKCFVPEKWKSHPSFDFAVTSIEFGVEPALSEVKLFNDDPTPMTGLDIMGIGFVDEPVYEAKIFPVYRLIKGNITRVSPGANSWSPRVFEASFPAVPGFSGGPVYIQGTDILFGMFYGNHYSKVLEREVFEFQDAESKFSEKIFKIQQFGLFHSVADMLKWVVELNPDSTVKPASNS